MPDITEEYADVLQNIELALVQVYREHDEMTDYEAQKAVNGLIRDYQAMERNRPEPTLRLTPLMEEAYASVKGMCDWRLGFIQMRDEAGREVEMGLEPITVPEMVACLRRIERSIKMWNKKYGRRGYFDFVQQFMP
jgi:hypothetical protein